jgi:hypothetical protein
LVFGPAVSQDVLRVAENASANPNLASAVSRESGNRPDIDVSSSVVEIHPVSSRSEVPGLIRLELVEEKLEKLDSLLGLISGCESEDEHLDARSQFFAQYR